MKNPTVKLNGYELDASLKYILEAGVSDFFPMPFEIYAIRDSWKKIQPILENVELLSYTPKECFEIIAPKQRCLVRPVHILDPIDTILFTALVLRLAPKIQEKRDQYQKDRVFSWHFNPSAIGTRDMFISKWDEYREQTITLCGQNNYVGTADIVDFFPRIYVHRLENAISDLSGDQLTTKALMRFIEKWAHGTSYGIPTGPRASNFLAEALLVEVDQFLISCDIVFLRWVDDYLFFGESEHKILANHFRLGTRLNQTQNLSLNSAKTRIRLSKEYKEQVYENFDPTIQLRNKIIDETYRGNLYEDFDPESLTDDEKEIINKIDVEKTLEEALEGEIVDLRAIRFVLTFLSALRNPDLIDLVLSNLHRLLPVAESVSKFFDSLNEEERVNHPEVGKKLIKFLSSGNFVPEFNIIWLLNPFTNSRAWNNLKELRKILRESNNRFICRQAILGIRQIGDRSAILDRKSTIDDCRDWEKRAVLYACSKLPTDEFHALVSHVGGYGGSWTIDNCLEKSVLLFAKKHS